MEEYKGWELTLTDGKVSLKRDRFSVKTVFNSFEEAKQKIDEKKDKIDAFIKAFKNKKRMFSEELLFEDMIGTANIGDAGPHHKHQIGAISKLRKRAMPKDLKGNEMSKKIVGKKKKKTTMSLASYLKNLKVVK